jgi:hypothetical protein
VDGFVECLQGTILSELQRVEFRRWFFAHPRFLQAAGGPPGEFAQDLSVDLLRTGLATLKLRNSSLLRLALARRGAILSLLEPDAPEDSSLLVAAFDHLLRCTKSTWTQFEQDFWIDGPGRVGHGLSGFRIFPPTQDSAHGPERRPVSHRRGLQRGERVSIALPPEGWRTI